MKDKQDSSKLATEFDWQERLRHDRIQIAKNVLPVAIGAAAGFSLIYFSIYIMLTPTWQWALMTVFAMLTTLLYSAAYFLVRRGRLTTAVYLMVAGIDIHVIAGPALVEGLLITGILTGFLALIFTRLTVGQKENRIVLTVSGVALLIGGLLYNHPVVEVASAPVTIRSFIAILTTIGVVFFVGLMLELRDERYEDSLSQVESYAKELSTQQQVLEERTFDLERQAGYLEATAEVMREAVSTLDLEDLLERVVTLINERFAFYRLGIFLLDASEEWVELRAASGEAVRETLDRGFRLRVGEEGIVGQVADNGEFYIASDVREDPLFVDDSDAVDVRSEIAIPLRAAGETIGVLDVQSAELGTFTEEIVAALRTLADQISLAIRNARLFEQAQKALKAERRAYGEFSREAWSEMIRARPDLGYRYDQGTITSLSDYAESSTAHDEGAAAADDLPELKLPIQVRGSVIGTLNAHKPGGAGEWTEGETAVMEAMVEQLGAALESARLYKDIQHRAARERLLGEITAQVRGTLDIDTILQTAVREMRDKLDLPEVVVKLAQEGHRHEM